MSKYKYALCLLFLCYYTGLAAQNINIIPQPKSVVKKQGYFILNDRVTILYSDSKMRLLAEYTVSTLKAMTGMQLNVTLTKENQKNRSINLLIDKNVQMGNEGYNMDVSPERITIKANSSQGLFYGVQTLLQLIPINADYKIPSVVIQDEPRFAWRGLLLDPARHFLTIDELKQFIDEMAWYKFNILHLHLTDCEGWRVEIKSIPELTRIGAWRVPRTGDWRNVSPPRDDEIATEGGFYTQEQIKDLVKYAVERNIQIMPEIEGPGHSSAAIVACPYLSPSSSLKKIDHAGIFYGIKDNTLCLGRESTFDFLDKVFTEVAELFPFEYIHVGGDECLRNFWKKCSECQKRIKDNNLKDENELQDYYTKRVEKILQSKGKKMIGWDDIIENTELSHSTAIMSWRGKDILNKAVEAKHTIVMATPGSLYLDYYQGDPAVEPLAIGGNLRLNKVYDYEPIQEGIDSSFIAGSEGYIWGEFAPTFRHVEYLAWPRGFALAEVLWSPKSKRNWSDFSHRTEVHLQRLAQVDVNYAPSIYDAIIQTSRDGKNNLEIQLSTEIEGLDMYYTFDNTFPDHHCPLYKKGEKLMIPTDADAFRIITYRKGKPLGRMITVTIPELEKRTSVMLVIN
jgi:hexosaminidase